MSTTNFLRIHNKQVDVYWQRDRERKFNRIKPGYSYHYITTFDWFRSYLTLTQLMLSIKTHGIFRITNTSFSNFQYNYLNNFCTLNTWKYALLDAISIEHIASFFLDIILLNLKWNRKLEICANCFRVTTLYDFKKNCCCIVKRQ